MTEERVEDRLKKMVVERLFMRIAPEEIDETRSLVDEYGVDSVSLLEMVVGIEEEFGVAIADEEFKLSLFETISSLADFVKSKMEA